MHILVNSTAAAKEPNYEYQMVRHCYYDIECSSYSHLPMQPGKLIMSSQEVLVDRHACIKESVAEQTCSTSLNLYHSCCNKSTAWSLLNIT